MHSRLSAPVIALLRFALFMAAPLVLLARTVRAALIVF